MSDDTDRAARKARADAIRAKVKELQAGKTKPAPDGGLPPSEIADQSRLLEAINSRWRRSDS